MLIKEQKTETCLLPSPCLNCDIEHAGCPDNCENYRLWDFGLQAFAELALLRQEKNDAIGAALQVEQRCYDQAQELKARREARRIGDGLSPVGIKRIAAEGNYPDRPLREYLS